MTKDTGLSAGTRFLITAAAFVVVVAGMRAAASLVVPFLLSAFIAIICWPPLFWMQRKGVPTPIAVGVLILGILVVGSLVGTFIGASVADFTRNLPVYQEQLQEKTGALMGLLERLGVDTSNAALSETLNPAAIMKTASGILASLGSMVTNGFLILLTVVFIMLEAAGLPAKMAAARGERKGSEEGFSTFIESVNRYLAIKTAISLVTGVIITIWLLILGVDYPVLWGLVAFLMNYVPNIGSIIAAVPAVLLALIQRGGGPALLVGAGYLVVNVVLGNVVEPRFMGRGLGLSTLIVFLSLVFWGWILGPVGMFLSVPLTMIVKIALESDEDTRWLGIFLGAGVEGD